MAALRRVNDRRILPFQSAGLGGERGFASTTKLMLNFVIPPIAGTAAPIFAWFNPRESFSWTTCLPTWATPATHRKVRLRRLGTPVHAVRSRDSQLRLLVRALRPHQWVKNLLIFVPLVLAHRLADTSALIATTWAAVAFHACASCVYLLNDMLDLEADRAHPKKRLRPLASGNLSLGWAKALIPALIAIALAHLLGVSAAAVSGGARLATWERICAIPAG